MKIMCAAIGMVAIIYGSAPASAQSYEWCSVTHHGSHNCAFHTHSHCVASVHGVGGYCIQNHHNLRH